MHRPRVSRGACFMRQCMLMRMFRRIACSCDPLARILRHAFPIPKKASCPKRCTSSLRKLSIASIDRQLLVVDCQSEACEIPSGAQAELKLKLPRPTNDYVRYQMLVQFTMLQRGTIWHAKCDA